MYPFIAEWSTESTSVPLSILAYVYSWLLIAYLIYRVVCAYQPQSLLLNLICFSFSQHSR